MIKLQYTNKLENTRFNKLGWREEYIKTVRPEFSWNFQDCNLTVWKDIPAPNLLPELIFTTLNVMSHAEQKIFFSIKFKTNNFL